jgi:hypothetical protein
MPRLSLRAAARPLTALAGAAVIVVGLAGTSVVPAGAKAKKTTTTTTTAPSNTSSTVVSAADTWLIKAIGAQGKVGSVRVSVNETSGKTKKIFSLLVNGDGEGSGTLVQSGTTIHMEIAGVLLYFKAPKSYWAAHAPAGQAAAFGGKWIEISALDSRFSAFDEFFNPSQLVAAVFLGHAAPLTLARPSATLAGHKVVVVNEKVTANGKTSSGEMWIEADGPPRALKIISKGPGQTTTITFSHFAKAVSISIPPEAINLTQAQASTAGGG